MPGLPVGDARRQPSLRAVACIGFLGHAPGIKLFTQVRFSTTFVRINAVAIGITLGTMGLTYYATASAQQVAIAWLVGHFLWSAILASWVLTGDSWREQQ